MLLPPPLPSPPVAEDPADVGLLLCLEDRDDDAAVASVFVVVAADVLLMLANGSTLLLLLFLSIKENIFAMRISGEQGAHSKRQTRGIERCEQREVLFLSSHMQR